MFFQKHLGLRHRSGVPPRPKERGFHTEDFDEN